MRFRRMLAIVAIAAVSSGCGNAPEAVRPLPPGEGVLLETEGEGWIRVSAASLLAAGLPPETETASLGLFRRGQPVAIRFLDDGPTTLGRSSGLEFGAEPSDSPFTERAVYSLHPTPDPLRIEDVVRPAGPLSSAPLRVRSVRAPESVYVITALNGSGSNFFWDGVVALQGPASKDFEVPARDLLREGTFRLTADLYGLSRFPNLDPDHHVRLLVNGSPVAEAWFDGEGEITVTGEAPAGLLDEALNTITLSLPHDLGAERDTVLVRSLALEYPRAVRAPPPGAPLSAIFREGGTWRIDALPAGTAAYDVTDPIRPRRLRTPPAAARPARVEEDLDGETTHPADPRPLVFTVEATDAAPARVRVMRPDAAVAPRAVRRSRAAEVLSDPEGAELLIVSPDALAEAAERLARHRRSTGTTSRVVSWEAVADAFGDGFPEPEAIAALVAHARAEWSRAPRFLLLLGDASYDPKGSLSDEPGGHRLPSFFTDSPFLETPTDNPFVAAGARSVPELAVGRMPAADAAEARAMVEKVIAYERAAPGAWAERVLLVADDAQATWEWQLFEQTSETLAAQLSPPLDPVRIYVGELGGAGARARLAEELATGALWVNYLGHGSYTGWAAENVLSDADVAFLPASDALPVFVVMNCLTGYYTHPNWKLRSLGEHLVTTPERGAVAVIASTALAYPGGQAELNLALAAELLADPGATLGEALARAKAALDPTDPDHADVIASWHLLGDPAMRLHASR